MKWWTATIAFLVTFSGLSTLGVCIAYLLVPEPLEYHRTRYFEFALPKGWHCDVEGTETVCFPKSLSPKDATIIFTAKFRNTEDNLDAYYEHLAKPRKSVRKDGTEISSEIRHLSRRMLFDNEWIDSLHYQSEIQNYYTRYLATVTSQISVLITFSAHKTTYESRAREFFKSIESLDIYQRPSRFN